jgi:hypothetical protein
MASVTVIMYRPAVAYFTGWSGDVGRSITRLGTMVAARQRMLAPKRTGKLAASIRMGSKDHWARGIQTTIGAQGTGAGYAIYMERGTRPHVITPRNPNGYMVFYWARVGHVVHRKKVFHPGTRPYFWAERGLREAFLAWNH